MWEEDIILISENNNNNVILLSGFPFSLASLTRLQIIEKRITLLYFRIIIGISFTFIIPF